MIAITIGEPAGIGPDIILQWGGSDEIVVIGNRALLQERAKLLNLPCNLNIIDIPLAAPVIPGQLDKRNAPFVMNMLEHAVDLALQKKISAIVTAPIHKGILNDAGFNIKGHTDFFAQKTGCDTVMMLTHNALRVALVTDHIPLRNVADHITAEKLSRCIDIIIHDCRDKFKISQPRILVCGLNTHAGENGYLGLEEKNIIIPVLEKYRAAGNSIIGPIGADVAFTKQYRDQADVMVAMYHDQGLPVIKYAGFHAGINITLGLPFVRTSVDHGTALDIAGTGRSDYQSLAHAILSASVLGKNICVP